MAVSMRQVGRRLCSAARPSSFSDVVLNSRRATGYVHRETGKRIDAPSHAFFFIRMELWALIIPAIFVILHVSDMRTDEAEASYMEDPAVGDIYTVNFREIDLPYGEGFEYGVLKIDGVDDLIVTFLVNELLCPKPFSIKSEIKKGKVDAPDYYSDKKFELPGSSLAGLKEDGIIHSIIRN